MTRAAFEKHMLGMALLVNAPTTAEKIDAYWNLFEAADESEFASGCARALRTRKFFPLPAELFEDCEASRPRVTWHSLAGEMVHHADARKVEIRLPWSDTPLVLKLDKTWKYYCGHCSDVGWREWWCGPSGATRPLDAEDAACGRRDGHAGHTWVTPCSCAKSNPAVLQARQRLADAAVTRTAKKDRDAA